MICTLLATLGAFVVLLLAYALLPYVRRKVTKANYNGKTVWITGASSGLGEYMTYEYNRCGAQLIISARNTTELKRVQQNCAHPQKVQIVKLDMTSYNQIETVTNQVLQKLEKQGRKLDVVVENAGVSMRCEFTEYAFQNHLALFNVNVNGPYRHLQLVVPHMLKNKSGQIIGITSQAGKISTAYRSSYGGSKAAFIGIMDSLRSELAPFGVRVCNLMPGYVKTNISINALGSSAGQKFGKTDTNIEQGMQPTDFAREAVAAAYNNENEVSIAKSWVPIFGIVLRNICPDLGFFFLLKNAKNQSKAVTNAKKE